MPAGSDPRLMHRLPAPPPPATDSSSGRTHRDARPLSLLYPGHFLRCYVYWKIRTDPLYPTVTRALHSATDQPLMDLGCGAGLFAFYLKSRGYTGHIRGLDVDAEKIAAARAIAAQRWPDSEFEPGDFATWDPGRHQGHVTFLDVLQYLSPELRHDLLSRAATCLTRPGHRLIIRNGLSDDSWRARVTHSTDHLARWIRWMARSPRSHPTLAALEAPLRASGLEVTSQPLWGATPFNNYLVIARRPA